MNIDKIIVWSRRIDINLKKNIQRMFKSVTVSSTTRVIVVQVHFDQSYEDTFNKSDSKNTYLLSHLVKVLYFLPVSASSFKKEIELDNLLKSFPPWAMILIWKI